MTATTILNTTFNTTTTTISTNNNRTRNLMNEIVHLTNIAQNTPTQILVSDFERIVKQINSTEAQNQEIFKSVVSLTSTLVENIITVNPTRNLVPPAFVTVILVFEDFVDRIISNLLNDDSFKQENFTLGIVQVVIQRIELSDQLIVMIPEQTQEASPAAHIPISVIKQFAKQNNASYSCVS